MWVCPKCQRKFAKSNQMHSCRTISLDQHFVNKPKAQEIFNQLLQMITKEIGKVEIISLPCCVHLYGQYDFLAALPKADKLEIRFALNRLLDSPRRINQVALSQQSYKNCIDVYDIKDVDEELLSWVKEAFFLKDKQES